MPTVSTIPEIPVAKLAAGVVDTGGKFTKGINNTSGTGGKIFRWCR
jgi:hypothetical protein